MSVIDDSSAVCSEPAGCMEAAPGYCRAGTQAAAARSEEFCFIRLDPRIRGLKAKQEEHLVRVKPFYLACIPGISLLLLPSLPRK